MSNVMPSNAQVTPAQTSVVVSPSSSAGLGSSAASSRSTATVKRSASMAGATTATATKRTKSAALCPRKTKLVTAKSAPTAAAAATASASAAATAYMNATASALMSPIGWNPHLAAFSCMAGNGLPPPSCMPGALAAMSAGWTGLPAAGMLRGMPLGGVDIQPLPIFPNLVGMINPWMMNPWLQMAWANASTAAAAAATSSYANTAAAASAASSASALTSAGDGGERSVGAPLCGMQQLDVQQQQQQEQPTSSGCSSADNGGGVCTSAAPVDNSAAESVGEDDAAFALFVEEFLSTADMDSLLPTPAAAGELACGRPTSTGNVSYPNSISAVSAQAVEEEPAAPACNTGYSPVAQPDWNFTSTFAPAAAAPAPGLYACGAHAFDSASRVSSCDSMLGDSRSPSPNGASNFAGFQHANSAGVPSSDNCTLFSTAADFHLSPAAPASPELPLCDVSEFLV